jgi:hypothetical protein
MNEQLNFMFFSSDAQRAERVNERAAEEDNSSSNRIKSEGIKRKPLRNFE